MFGCEGVQSAYLHRSERSPASPPHIRILPQVKLTNVTYRLYQVGTNDGTPEVAPRIDYQGGAREGTVVGARARARVPTPLSVVGLISY